MKQTQSSRGFTLVEVMVSASVMLVLLLVLLAMVNQTSAMWRFTASKAEQFRSARDGFEAMTRRLSQATLNTYWDYERDAGGSPRKYVRQSELRFIIGSGEELIGNARASGAETPRHVTHATFFQAPLGYVDRIDKAYPGTDSTGSRNPYAGLESLVNTWGYFVEFNSDRSSRPPFINAMSPPPADRFRYRLMEFMEPSDRLTIYNYTSGLRNGVAKNLSYSSANPASGLTGREWFTDSLALAEDAPVRVLAENIVALIILPKLSPQDDPTGTKLAKSYRYDSTATSTDPRIDPKNQLPPVVQVTMVALDEISANRIATGASMPDFGQGDLFSTKAAGSAANLLPDLETLQKTLAAQRLSFRVFTTNVSIHGAKWSRD
jgi:uncharacterized protein (TIGR02599 family)